MDTGRPYSESGSVPFWCVMALCVFIPPLAIWLERPGSRALPWDVYIWVDIALCFLFFFPGIILAFIVAFTKPQLKSSAV